MLRTGHHRASRKKILLTMTALATVAAFSPATAQSTGAGPTPATRVMPLYGNLSPFYGNLQPFYGNIQPFYGNIQPFWGNLQPFWGNLNPFYGNIQPFWGNLTPFYGNIQPFDGAPEWGEIGTFWTGLGGYWNETDALWGAAGALPGQRGYKAVGDRLDEIVRRSEATWGEAVREGTGKSFREGFAEELFARHGIDPGKPKTLGKLSAAERARFFLDWYDGLMAYSGRDRADHWMRTVNWTPAITQVQGSGGDTIIGLLDATAKGGGDDDLDDSIEVAGGYTSKVKGHGAGVVSLMVAAHDGQGVMGIAPAARVVAYNPFDDTNTASWADVTKGIVALSENGASVVNMSLGVRGWTLHPDWRSVFSDTAVAAASRNIAFVLAAGNDGKAQTQNIAWDGATDPNLIVVGSIDTAGRISAFSNRPGTACLLKDGVCEEQNRLMNRFMVAPGELLLVADGEGGVVRQTGTSFAAPLVSGAIALLHDRWPWLARHPKETVEIILRSARDLGAPGTDSVYGRGLLDVEASQSPLDFDKLLFGEVKNGAVSLGLAPAIRAGGFKTSWDADGVFFYLLEPIGSTYRDFAVPMSSKLVGSVGAMGGSQEHFQDYVTDRLTDWIITGNGFTDIATQASPDTGGWRLAFSARNPSGYVRDRNAGLATHNAVRISAPNGRFALSAGHGEGAVALAALPGFGLSGDYTSDGGVNPLLGLASGGAFAGADIGLSDRTTVSLGMTERSLAQSENPAIEGSTRASLRELDDYEAGAASVRLTHQASDRVTVTAAYARVREENGLLGVQSIARGDLRHGSASDTATLGFSFKLPHDFTFAAAATAGRTIAAGDQSLTTAGDGVLTSAYAFALSKRNVLGGGDMLRLSLAQPLQIESGTLSLASAEIIDRETGAIGVVETGFDISGGDRRYTGEMLYAAPIFGGGGEASLFGRLELRSSESLRVDDFLVGGRLSVGF